MSTRLPPPTPPSPPTLRSSPIPHAPDTLTSRPAAGTRPGQLVGWATVAHLIVWAASTAVFAQVAYSSNRTGFGLCWVTPGGRGFERLTVIIPFVLPLVMIIGALGLWRRLPLLGVLAAAVTAVLGIVDLGWSHGYALVELVLAGAQLLVSVLTLGGVYRAGRSVTQPAAPSDR